MSSLFQLTSAAGADRPPANTVGSILALISRSVRPALLDKQAAGVTAGLTLFFMNALQEWCLGALCSNSSFKTRAAQCPIQAQATWQDEEEPRAAFAT
jgi:hypothetical protein